MIRLETNTSSSRGREQDRADESKREEGPERGVGRDGRGEREMGAEAGEGGGRKSRRSEARSSQEHEGLVQSLTQAQRLRDRVAMQPCCSTASSGGASAALDISSHPRYDLLSQAKVILQQAALSGGAISRAAVNRIFRLPPATTFQTPSGCWLDS
ncbi:unnamed protein product [Closterium sp. NIES-65]|nr:unnamed protein product [Closterium sp. NIES-65]